MPHCIIEYTRDVEDRVDIGNLIDVAFEAVESTALFDRGAIKARAKGYDYFKAGQSSDDYIHICLKILPGRTDEQKKLLSSTVFSSILPHVETVKSLSVEVVDLHGPSYSKRVI